MAPLLKTVKVKTSKFKDGVSLFDMHSKTIQWENKNKKAL